MNIMEHRATARQSTWMGIVSILLWSTTIAFSRSLTEQLGTWTAASLIYTVAGLAGLLIVGLQPNGFTRLRRLPRAYLLVCGGLFVLYMASLYLAIGSAETRVQVLAVGLINYLWPAFSLLFSIPILGCKARPLLPVGIILALAGVWLASANGGDVTFGGLLQERGSALPYGLALISAISWGLYSNLSRRLGAENESGAVPLFLLASGILLAALRVLTPEVSAWTPGAGLALAYMALLPGMLAYVLWDIAVRQGEIILIASLSYLTPLLSTLFSSLILKVQPSAALWLGAGLVMAGAFICKSSIIDHSESGHSTNDHSENDRSENAQKNAPEP